MIRQPGWHPGRFGEWRLLARRPDGPGLQIDVTVTDGRVWWVLAEYDADGHAADLLDGEAIDVATAKTAGLDALKRWQRDREQTSR